MFRSISAKNTIPDKLSCTNSNNFKFFINSYIKPFLEKSNSTNIINETAAPTPKQVAEAIQKKYDEIYNKYFDIIGTKKENLPKGYITENMEHIKADIEKLQDLDNTCMKKEINSIEINKLFKAVKNDPKFSDTIKYLVCNTPAKSSATVVNTQISTAPVTTDTTSTTAPSSVTTIPNNSSMSRFEEMRQHEYRQAHGGKKSRKIRKRKRKTQNKRSRKGKTNRRR